MMGRDGANRIDDKKRWIIFAIFLIQIFILLFYLEILEFNFCSLNKNTKKSIIERKSKESFTIEDINRENELDNEIELKGYDIGEIMKKQYLEDCDLNEEDKKNDHHN